MKVGFYITAITDFQDMLPVIAESIRRGQTCWIAVLDCLSQKRQFYYYDKKEVLGSLRGFFVENGLKDPLVKFYGLKEENDFISDYASFAPDVVYVQNIQHKYPAWIPRADDSMVVSFAWHHDSVNHFKKSFYDISLNVVRRSDELRYFSEDMPDWLRSSLDSKEYKKVCNINTRYFGNLRLESLDLIPKLSHGLTPVPEKSCLLIETQVRKGRDSMDSVSRMADSMMSRLKELGYKIYWKKREKGYPVKNTSVLDHCKHAPDVIVDKDLNLPSSMVFLAHNCKVCFTLQTSTSYWDLKKINDNSAMIIPSPPGSREPRMIKNYYSKGDAEVGLNMIYMSDEDAWKKIDEMLFLENKPKLNPLWQGKKPSGLILDEVKKIWEAK